MRPIRPLPLLALVIAVTASPALSFAAPIGDPSGVTKVTLKPEADTWTSHDDPVVHGQEATLKIGMERQACVVSNPKNICTNKSPAQQCCPGKTAEELAYCAPKGKCAETTPSWDAFRSFRTYIRFDLTKLPKGHIMAAEVSLRAATIVQKLGGPPKIVTARLKKIGPNGGICEWDEKTLVGTDGTTWSALPQNLSVAADGNWHFDVTKAVADWTTGNTDYKDVPIEANCGFHMYDPDFGKPDAPIERWVIFSSKEGAYPPELHVTVAQDLDGDGHTADVDCDESNAKVSPGAKEICDGVDNDCSGGVDDEVCDGLDNDCDGLVDEGPGQSGVAPCLQEGFTCANHACVQSCASVCGGPFDRKCGWDEDKKLWFVYGCGLVGASPCYTWYKYSPCNEGQNCEYGSCSFNCVDTCDVEGAVDCVKYSLGRWHLGECGKWDVDKCLEYAYVEDCKPAASCAKDPASGNNACAGGCTETCSVLGEVTCGTTASPNGPKAAATVCKDVDGDGCLDKATVLECVSGNCSEPLGCTLEGSKPAEDAGATDVEAVAADVTVPADAEADALAADAAGNEDVATDVATGVDSGEVADAAAVEVADGVQPGAEIAPLDGFGKDAGPATTGGGGSSDSGCSAGAAGSRDGGVAWLVAVGALWALGRRDRRAAGA